jgi:hypothetical protein
VGLLVGAGALERRQERVVDVDDPAGQARAEVVGQHLHVPGEHDELDVELVDQRLQPGLGGGLRVRRHGHVVEADAVEVGQRPQRLVVGDDGHQVDRQALGALPEGQVVEAVRGRGHHDERAHRPAGDVQRPVHGEPGRQRAEGAGQVVVRGGRGDLDPHEELPGHRAALHADVVDVAVVLGDQPGHRRDDAGAVGAGQGENPVGRVGHEARE